MDSEQRHDLKENDLKDFFTHFGEWWNKWGNTILIVFVIFALSFLAYRLWNNSITAAHENAWTDLVVESSPAGYAAIAESYSNPAVKVLALIRGGDAAVTQAMGPDALSLQATAAKPTDEAEIAALVDEAAALYEQALAASDLPVYQANARLGLGSVAEMRQNWDEAKNHYEQVIALAGINYPTLTEQAQARIDLLPQLSQPIAFAPAPPAESTPQGSNDLSELGLPALDPADFEMPTLDLSTSTPGSIPGNEPGSSPETTSETTPESTSSESAQDTP